MDPSEFRAAHYGWPKGWDSPQAEEAYWWFVNHQFQQETLQQSTKACLFCGAPLKEVSLGYTSPDGGERQQTGYQCTSCVVNRREVDSPDEPLLEKFGFKFRKKSWIIELPAFRTKFSRLSLIE